jgi:hypothetical protein
VLWHRGGLLKKVGVSSTNVEMQPNTNEVAERHVQQELDILKRQVLSLSLEKHRRDGESSGPPPAPSIDVKEPSEDRETRAERTRARNAQVERAFSTIVDEQYPDSPWAGDTERVVEKAIASADPTMKLESAKCGVSLCRVIVRHKNEASKAALAERVADKEPFRNGTVYAYDGLVSTMYVTREGHDFPAIPTVASR